MSDRIHIVLRTWPDYEDLAPELEDLHEVEVTFPEGVVMEGGLTWGDGLKGKFPHLLGDDNEGGQVKGEEYFVKRLEFSNPEYKQYTWNDEIRTLINENVNKFLPYYAVIVGKIQDPKDAGAVDVEEAMANSDSSNEYQYDIQEALGDGEGSKVEVTAPTPPSTPSTPSFATFRKSAFSCLWKGRGVAVVAQGTKGASTCPQGKGAKAQAQGMGMGQLPEEHGDNEGDKSVPKD